MIEKLMVQDLIGKDVTGITCNMVLFGGLWDHLYPWKRDPAEWFIRTLKKVYVKKAKAPRTGEVQSWLYWEWEPKSHVFGHGDCGYSGVLLDEKNVLENLYLERGHDEI